MTVGEKILLYRKSLQMSQDELGQRLSVSRQTVSLWETGQTLPTIDNLLLLKEIFGVSVDELLSPEVKEEEKAEERAESPKESYTFTFTPQEYIKMQKISSQGTRFFMIVSIILLCAWVVFLGFKSNDNFGDGSLFGLLLMLICVNIGRVVYGRKSRNRAVKSVCETAYRYEIYSDFFLAELYSGGERVQSSKVYYNKIEKITDLEDYYIFGYSGQSFYLKKQELAENSLLFEIVSGFPKKLIEKPDTLRWRVISTALNVFSICTLFMGFCLLMVLGLGSDEVVPYFWIFALFTPITAASVLIGFYLKKTKDRGRANIIIGIVTTCVLLVLSTFSFVFPLLAKDADRRLEQVQIYAQMDIPDYQSYKISSSGDTEVAVFTFNERAVEDFESSLFDSVIWIKAVPRTAEPLANRVYNLKDADYFFIYNVDTGEYNTMPAESGTYNFVNVMYGTGYNELKVVEYVYQYEK